MKRTIEIEDSLKERTTDAIAEIEELLRAFLKDNPDFDHVPDLWDDLDRSSRVHYIIDSSVPLTYYEIECTWFLNVNELEEAYENADIGDNPRDNYGMAAIYCYIKEQVSKWYEETAECIYDEVMAENEKETEE